MGTGLILRADVAEIVWRRGEDLVALVGNPPPDDGRGAAFSLDRTARAQVGAEDLADGHRGPAVAIP